MLIDKEPDFFSKQVAQARRFYIQSSNLKNRIRVFCGGCEHTAPEFEINRNDFPYYCLEFVAKGAGSVTLNDDTYELKAGAVFSYGPGISQHITSDAKQPMIKYFVDFKGASAKRIIEHYIAPLGTAVYVNRPDELTTVFDSLLQHGLSDTPYRPMICSISLEYLLYRIAEMAFNPKDAPGKAFATYQFCRNYIKEHVVTLHSLEDIAADCMVDPAYLCRLFKRFDTQSPYQYLLNLKMTYAANRFQDSGVSVKQTAHELGFSDPFHFSRAFKRVFGVSPHAFKKLR